MLTEHDRRSRCLGRYPAVAGYLPDYRVVVIGSKPKQISRGACKGLITSDTDTDTDTQEMIASRSRTAYIHAAHGPRLGIDC